LFYGDCLEAFTYIPTESVDLIITSPPYNLKKEYENKLSEEQYFGFIQRTMVECFRVLKKSGRICWNVIHQCRWGRDGDIYPMARKHANKLEEVGFRFFDHLIWNQGYSDSATAWGSWLSPSAPFIQHKTEAILVFYKKQWPLIDRGESDLSKKEFITWTNNEVWDIPPVSATSIGHPAPFPEELPKRCMKLFSYKNAIILDPFLGSGTVMKVAQDNDRSCIGMELKTEYIDLIKKRCWGRQFLNRDVSYDFVTLGN